MKLSVNRVGALEYLTAPCLAPVAHGFSTRFGGVSGGYLASLNLGMHRGDAPENVEENYARLGAAIGFSPADTVFTRQVHGDRVERVGRQQRGRGLRFPVQEPCDGLITNEPGVALTVFSADCTPILLYDPVKRAIGAVHAGWRGTAAQIAKRAVEGMCREFGCCPADIRAAIGPCISMCCFETDGDVPQAMLASFGEAAQEHIRPVGEKYYVNLKGLNALALRQAGVRTLDIAQACTACQPQRFWSHRRVGNERGSLAAVIVLREEPA